MPVHNWTADYAWLVHDFHGEWIGAIKHALNGGVLPPDYYARTEQVTVGVIPDVIALRDSDPDPADTSAGGVLLVEPETRVVETIGRGLPHRKNRVAVKHATDDRTVAVIEIVSPGNKDGKHSFRAFLDEAVDLLAKGIHLLVIDLHAPTRRGPNGIHAAIRDELGGGAFVPPPTSR